MIEALIDGERRGQVLADLAIGRMRSAGKLADLSMALAGRFTDHHALLCRLHRDRIAGFDDGVDGLDKRIAGKAGRWQRETGLLKTLPGFGDVVAQAWLGEIGPAPHLHFATCEKLASWVTLCPGNNISARKRKHGRTGDAGTYIKPMLIQAAWAAIRVRGRLQARYNRLVRRFGGDKNPAAKKKAITARAPSSRSPTRSSRLAPRTRNQAPIPAPGGNHPSRSRPGWNARCRSSTQAALSPSPSARRRPPYHLAVNHEPPSRPAQEPPPAPPSRPFRRTSQRHCPALTTAQVRVRCRAPTGDPVIVSVRTITDR